MNWEANGFCSCYETLATGMNLSVEQAWEADIENIY